MSPAGAAVLQILILALLLAVAYRPLGDFLARILQSPKHSRVETALYKVTRVDPDADQRWSAYALGVLAFSFVSVLFLYLFQRVQHWLPLSLGDTNVKTDTAWNTAVSFVTNTNWQSYSGESTMGHLVQMAGLAVQNFASAAVGISIAFALLRGLTRSRTDRVGNFWVDLTRVSLRLLLPIAFVSAILLIAGGSIQNFHGAQAIQTLGGHTQNLMGGPVASQEAIKELGTNGGGFFNANSAHPFENPNAWTNLLQIFLLLVIPFSLCRTFGRLVGSAKQGFAVAGTMALILFTMISIATIAEMNPSGSVAHLAGAAMEGKETRFGPAASALYAASTTGTSTGAVNSFHDSFTATGGGVPLVSMMLGEVSPGGVGTGLYGILMVAVIAVFIAGLMVGRTPEFLGKKVGKREITLSALYVLVMPALVLTGAAITAGVAPLRNASISQSGPHGLSTVLYAYTSGANNNGSAFGSFGAATLYQNTALGLVMLFGRLLPILLVLALAGSFARQIPVPRTQGTLQTHSPTFVGMLLFTIVVVAGLTFFPALALGPIAEALS